MILFLVKVFEQEEHARDFVNGTMFVNRLFHFKKLGACPTKIFGCDIQHCGSML